MSNTMTLAELAEQAIIKAAEAAGWHIAYVGKDGSKEQAGYWAYQGEHDNPDRETGIFDTVEQAARAALDLSDVAP